MMPSRYNIQIVVRVLLICLNCVAMAFALRQPNHLFTLVVVFSVLAVQVALLIRYLNQSSSKLRTFYESLLNQDYTTSLTASGTTEGRELQQMLNEVNKQLMSMRVSSEASYQYLKLIVDQVDTGLVAFDAEGNTEFANAAALRLLSMPSVKRFEQLDLFYNGLCHMLNEMQPDTRRIIRLPSSGGMQGYSVGVGQFRYQGRLIRLISFRNISNEIGETEQRSWEKLIRVLTHEIMNSVSPINSLTTTLGRIYQPDGKPKSVQQLSESDVDDTISGLGIISRRSQGLMDFVKRYRQVYSVPQPVKEKFRVRDMVDAVVPLCSQPVAVEVLPDNLDLVADRAMVEQVLVNLLKNASEAVAGVSGALVQVKAYRNQKNRVVVVVLDNGVGMPPEVLDDIFVPFFTTKKEGSGVGLSLSRQIMHLHGGEIAVASQPGKGCEVCLEF